MKKQVITKVDYFTSEQITNLYLKGVYIIRCLPTNKIYVGSTHIYFHKRFREHNALLLRNAHKNKHLQNSFNKYGKESIRYEILEIVNDKANIFPREQYWMDKYKCTDRNTGFNINPLSTGTPNLSKETVTKRSQSILKHRNKCVYYYDLLKNKKIKERDIPKKYIKTINFWKNNVPWNKGKKLGSCEYLKVKKTKTERWHKARKEALKIRMDKSKRIFVYDIENNYIDTWKNAHELHKESLKKDFKLIPYMKLRNLSGRNGYSPYMLHVTNIQKCALGKSELYKGLQFKYFGPTNK